MCSQAGLFSPGFRVESEDRSGHSPSPHTDLCAALSGQAPASEGGEGGGCGDPETQFHVGVGESLVTPGAGPHFWGPALPPPSPWRGSSSRDREQNETGNSVLIFIFINFLTGCKNVNVRSTWVFFKNQHFQSPSINSV